MNRQTTHTPLLIGLFIAGGAFLIVVVGLCVWLITWVASAPVGGVKLANEMDQYALDYLAEHEILNPGEDPDGRPGHLSQERENDGDTGTRHPGRPPSLRILDWRRD